MHADDNKLLPLLGAEVTYTVVFINADTAYPRMTIGVTTTLPSADDSYPTSVTSCKTGATSITLPVASLAANTALVCTFKVRVRADHVAFKKLPKITLQATNGSTTISTISTSPPNNELPGLSVYTRPSLAIYNYLDDGEQFVSWAAAQPHINMGLCMNTCTMCNSTCVQLAKHVKMQIVLACSACRSIVFHAYYMTAISY